MSIPQLLVCIHVTWLPMLVMLEERVRTGVLWSFIHFLHISGYSGWIRSVSAFCSWNSVAVDGITVPWETEESPETKHHRKHPPWAVQKRMCNQLNCGVNACILPLPTSRPSNKNPRHPSVKEILTATGIITFARLYRARKLLLLSRSLQHQAISASGDVRRWSPCQELINIGEEILTVCFSK